MGTLNQLAKSTIFLAQSKFHPKSELVEISREIFSLFAARILRLCYATLEKILSVGPLTTSDIILMPFLA